MDHDFAVGVGVAVGDDHAERARDEREVLAVIDRPANDASTERVENEAAVKLSFSRVGCSVMSVTHNRSGPTRAKSRSTRSVAVAVAVTTRGTFLRRFGPGRPYIWARDINISMALWPTLTPRPRASSAWTRRAP